ncbi:Protrudin [Manis pentadactyla]|nr:Protrudin [Manis pentadactyla]
MRALREPPRFAGGFEGYSEYHLILIVASVAAKLRITIEYWKECLLPKDRIYEHTAHSGLFQFLCHRHAITKYYYCLVTTRIITIIAIIKKKLEKRISIRAESPPFSSPAPPDFSGVLG